MKYSILMCMLATAMFAQNYHGCAIAQDNLNGWVVRIDSALIMHTSDCGVSWNTQANPDTNTRRFFDITCVDQFRAWTVGILGEVLNTQNGGLTWVRQIEGLSKYGTRIEFLDEDYGWVACGDGTVARTTNGGTGWEQNFTPWYSAEFYGIWFVNQWDGWIVAGYPDSMLTGQGIIAKSTDGGITWDSLLQVTGYEDFFDVYFFHLLDGVVVGGDEADSSAIILKTTDGGLSWNTITPPANSYYLRALEFVGTEGWAVGRFGTILHTTDSGDTWSHQSSPATTTLFDVDFSDTEHGFICGIDIILRTTNGGQTWIETGISEHKNETIQSAQFSTFPNPFREKTIVSFQNSDCTMQNEQLSINIFDISGRLVKNLSLPTAYSLLPTVFTWDGTDNTGTRLASGIYIIKLVTDNSVVEQKVVLLD